MTLRRRPLLAAPALLAAAPALAQAPAPVPQAPGWFRFRVGGFSSSLGICFSLFGSSLRLSFSL